MIAGSAFLQRLQQSYLQEGSTPPDPQVGKLLLLAKLEIETLQEALRAERDTSGGLRTAFNLAGKYCREVHHPKSMQHGKDEECPVEKLLIKAMGL